MIGEKMTTNLFAYLIKKTNYFLSFGMLLIFITADAHAEKEIDQQYGVSVFSNFCRSELSGDLYGNRITILKVSGGKTVMYEYNDGSTHAAVANNLNVEEMNGKISFEVMADKDLHSIIVGEFSADGEVLRIKGTLFDENSSFDLMKIHDFKLPYPFCVKKK